MNKMLRWPVELPQGYKIVEKSTLDDEENKDAGGDEENAKVEIRLLRGNLGAEQVSLLKDFGRAIGTRTFAWGQQSGLRLVRMKCRRPAFLSTLWIVEVSVEVMNQASRLGK